VVHSQQGSIVRDFLFPPTPFVCVVSRYPRHELSREKEKCLKDTLSEQRCVLCPNNVCVVVWSACLLVCCLLVVCWCCCSIHIRSWQLLCLRNRLSKRKPAPGNPVAAAGRDWRCSWRARWWVGHSTAAVVSGICGRGQSAVSAPVRQLICQSQSLQLPA
jgi:hypothetical protein